MVHATCTNCGYKSSVSLGFWSLKNYHNISGYFCGSCYDKVSHDSYGNPEQPGEYIAILLKQTAQLTPN
jgi:hypothetical protein